MQIVTQSLNTENTVFYKTFKFKLNATKHFILFFFSIKLLINNKSVSFRGFALLNLSYIIPADFILTNYFYKLVKT